MTDTTARPATTVALDIGGMTCASCAARITKRLNKLDGVEASVNYATERAAITVHDPSVSAEQLIEQVEAIGYTAKVPHALHAPHDHSPSLDASDDDAFELRTLRHRLVGSAVLGIPVLLLSMITALQFTNWQWLCLALAAPVVTWGAWPFHRATWLNLRHGAATMDTLISLGTVAAFGWSVYALFWGDAGRPGMTMSLSFSVERGAGQQEIYLEIASVVIVFILAGRYFEARAKRSSS